MRICITPVSKLALSKDFNEGDNDDKTQVYFVMLSNLASQGILPASE